MTWPVAPAAPNKAATEMGLTMGERTRGPLGSVLCAAGAGGFVLGAVGYADWQVAVETSQVLAGLVSYPPDNPFFLYHTQLWTILHQVLAPLLWAGVSERTASLLVSGVLGMLSLQAFASVILAISRDPLLAVGGAVAVFFTHPTEYGVAYPVWFAGTSHTYGVVGMSYLVLVIGLLGGGWLRVGGFLLGLAPAVHPSLAIWLGVIVITCLLQDVRRFRQLWCPGVRPFLLGGAASAASLLAQRLFIRVVPTGADAASRDLYLSFIELWDYHRRPVSWGNRGVVFNGVVLAAALFFLCRRPEAFPDTSRIVPRAAVAASLVAFASLCMFWVPTALIPQTLLILMPTRVINVAIVLSLPLLLGMLGRDRRCVPHQILLLLLLAGLLFGGDLQDGVFTLRSSRLWELLMLAEANISKLGVLMIHPWAVMAFVAAGLAITVPRRPHRGAAVVGGGADTPGTDDSVSPLAPWLRRASLSLLAAIAVCAVWLAWLRHERSADRLEDRTNNPVLAAAAAGEGLLLTGGDLHLVQLRTRRPVLIDGGGLDGIAATRGALPATARIVSRVYQIDFFDPPLQGRGRGAIPEEFARAAWEPKPQAFWRAIRAEYGVTEVLTKADWTLDLPLVARDRSLALYRIPSGP